MHLLLGIGNTNLCFGLHNGTELVQQLRLETRAAWLAGQWQEAISTWLLETDMRQQRLKGAVVGSVVPALTPVLQQVLTALCEREPLMLSPAVYPQLNVQVQNLSEIGADLVANAVAGFALTEQRGCIIADFGTALTFTCVADTGVVEGVSIAPGIGTAVNSLFQQTAQLPVVPLNYPQSALGKNTPQAVQVGILRGYYGLVQHLLNDIEKELACNCLRIATGGLFNRIPPLKELFHLHRPNHTLEGLRLIGRQTGYLPTLSS
jgi:type III pantothenate kinase